MIPITTIPDPFAVPDKATAVNANLALLSAAILIPFGPITLSTAGGAVDKATISVPFSRYLPLAVTIESVTAAGTLAAATIDIRTAAAGGGASILSAPTALTAATAVDKIVSITPVATDVRTAPTLTLRQTVDSGNAGTISGVLVVRPLP